MPKLGNSLDIAECPHCRRKHPSLIRNHHFDTTDHRGENQRHWSTYVCAVCGSVVTAFGNGREANSEMVAYFPTVDTFSADAAIPDRARTYLQQATASTEAPVGAVMLAASAVDAMLKAKGYKEGSLYSRIDAAAKEHLITEGMAKWAHAVRLDANDQRHADESAELPTQEDARRALRFALALGEFLFVLPARVEGGLREAKA
jgi:hypothetical protein